MYKIAILIYSIKNNPNIFIIFKNKSALRIYQNYRHTFKACFKWTELWNLKGFSSNGHRQWTYRTKVGEVHRNQSLSPLQPISYVHMYVLFLQISPISFLLTQYPRLTWWLNNILTWIVYFLLSLNICEQSLRTAASSTI